MGSRFSVSGNGVAGTGVSGFEVRVSGFGFRVAGTGVSGFGFRGSSLFFFFTLVTGPRRSLSLKLSDTKVYEPHIRGVRGYIAHVALLQTET